MEQPPVTTGEPPVYVNSNEEPSVTVKSAGQVMARAAKVGAPVVGAPVGEAVVGGTLALVGGGAVVGGPVGGADVGARSDGRTKS